MNSPCSVAPLAPGLLFSAPSLVPTHRPLDSLSDAAMTIWQKTSHSGTVLIQVGDPPSFSPQDVRHYQYNLLIPSHLCLEAQEQWTQPFTLWIGEQVGSIISQLGFIKHLQHPEHYDRKREIRRFTREESCPHRAQQCNCKDDWCREQKMVKTWALFKRHHSPSAVLKGAPLLIGQGFLHPSSF